MSRLDRQSVAWLRAHNQAISNSQLFGNGVSLGQRKRLVANEQISRVLHGAYVAGSAEPDEVMLQSALCLAHPELVIAGPSAGRHWRLRFMPDDGLVHAIAPPASHPCSEPWVEVYRTPLLDPEDIVTLSDGRRVTSPPRTAVDLTRYVTPSTLASINEHVLSLRYCSEEGLRRSAERLDTPGRPWVRRYLRVLAGRLPGAPSESHGEFNVLGEFQRRGVRDMVRQLPITLPGYGPARFDLHPRVALGVRGRSVPVTLDARGDRTRPGTRCRGGSDRVGHTARRTGAAEPREPGRDDRQRRRRDRPPPPRGRPPARGRPLATAMSVRAATWPHRSSLQPVLVAR